jgi:hypothetical protein
MTIRLTSFTRLQHAAILAVSILSASAHANTSLWDLSIAPLQQDWTNTALITDDDIWSGVPSFMGYRGDNGTALTGTDPQTIIADLSAVIDVNVGQTPTFVTGGVAEFELTNPVVAFQGSGTADAPNLVAYLNATGLFDISVSYLLRDVDGTTDNAIQAVSLQYRVNGTGNYINVPTAFVADASTGPSLADLTTPVSVTLPSDANGASMLEVRWITANAGGNDEWVGVDNIVVNGTAVPEPSTTVLLLGATILAAMRRRQH